MGGERGSLEFGHHVENGELDVSGVNREDVALKYSDQFKVERLQSLVICERYRTFIDISSKLYFCAFL